MNRLLVFFLATILFLSCQKEASETLVPKGVTFTGPNGVRYDNDSISIPEELYVNKAIIYQTLTDTLVFSSPAYTIPFYALVGEKDSLTMKADVEGYTNPEISYRKSWNPNFQKWIATFTLSLSTAKLKGLSKITATFKKAGKPAEIVRTSIISSTEVTRTTDVYSLSFGMSRDEAKQSETERFAVFKNGGSWNNPQPTYAYATGPQHEGKGIIYYDFVDNKLVRISDVVTSNTEAQDVLKAAKRFKIPQEPTIRYDSNTQKFVLNKSQSWSYGKLKLTLSERTINIDRLQTQFVILSYEKP